MRCYRPWQQAAKSTICATAISVILVIGITLRGQSQPVKLSEFQFANDKFPDEKGQYLPWIELQNTTTEPVALSGYSLKTCMTCASAPLPDITIQPKGNSTVWLSGTPGDGHAVLQVDQDLRTVYVYDNSSEQIIDSLIIYAMPETGTSLARSPDTNGWYYYPENKVSFGFENPLLGNWRKILNAAAFRVGDSGGFGCLVHHNKMYILDYESRDETAWFNIVEVWDSSNGTDWNLINPNPPYQHWISRFVSYNDSIYAFDGSVYRSYDGANWEKLKDGIPLFTRVIVFKNKLIGLVGNSLYESLNGLEWKIIVNDLPWYYRSGPALQTMNGKLWVFGGSLNYNSGFEMYYQDVWYSDDAINWHLATNKAPWVGNIWSTYAAFDNKLWVLSGYNVYRELSGIAHGNSDEVWYSEDGKNWTQLITPEIWLPRHAPFTWVYNDALWVAAGYGGGGVQDLYNDVWRFEKFTTKQSLQIRLSDGEILDELTVTYGDNPLAFEVSSNTFQPLSGRTGSDAVIALKDNKLHILNAGQDTLVVTQEGNDYFEAGSISLPITVNKKDLIVSPIDTTQSILTPHPVITLVYDGFVNGDTVGDLERLPAASIDAHEFAPVGTYPITVSGGLDHNYNFVYSEGEFTIVGRPEVHTFPNPSTEFVNVVFSEHPPEGCTIFLADQLGRTLSRNSLSGSNSATIDVRGIAPGIYFLSSLGCAIDGTSTLIIK